MDDEVYEYIEDDEEVKTNEEILKNSIDTYIEEIMDIYKIPLDLAIILLNITNFDKDKISIIIGEYTTKVPLEGDNKTCESCLSSINEIYCLDYNKCNHNICKQCYKQQINFNDKEYPTTCIICDIPILYSLNDINTLLTDYSSYELKKIVYNIIMHKFIASKNSIFLYCINTECNKLLYNELEQSEYKCPDCGIIICTKCKHEYHLPANCKDNKEWVRYVNTKLRTETDDKWIILNCKRCPNCDIPIDKIKSCVKMTCYNCHHVFCWVCLQNYDTHITTLHETGFYKCPFASEIEKIVSIDIKLLRDYENYIELLKAKFGYNYKILYDTTYYSLPYVIKIISNIIIYYNYNKTNDSIISIIHDNFVSLTALISELLSDPELELIIKNPILFKYTPIYKKINILINYFIKLDNIIVDSFKSSIMHSKNIELIHDNKHIAFWYSESHPTIVFTPDQIKTINKNLILMNYNFILDEYTFNLIEFTFILNDNPSVIMTIKKIIKNEFACKSCTYINSPQASIDNTCTICNFVN